MLWKYYRGFNKGRLEFCEELRSWVFECRIGKLEENFNEE